MTAFPKTRWAHEQGRIHVDTVAELDAADQRIAELERIAQARAEEISHRSSVTLGEQARAESAERRAERADQRIEKLERERDEWKVLIHASHKERDRLLAADQRIAELQEWADQQIKRGDDEQKARKAAEQRIAELETQVALLQDLINTSPAVQRIAELTAERDEAVDYARRVAVDAVDRARMPLGDRAWIDSVARADAAEQRIEKLEAALREIASHNCGAPPWDIASDALRDLDATEGQTP